MSRRILGVVMAVTILALVTFSVPAALAIHRAQERGEILELQREASIAASRVPAFGPIDESVLQPIVDSEHRLGIYGPDGRLLGGIGPASADPIVRLGIAGNFAEGRVDTDLVAAVPIRIRPDGTALVIRIEAPGSQSTSRFVRSIGLLALEGAAVLLVAGVVGLLLARRLNRPVDALRNWATRADTDRERLPPDPTGIAELDALRSALIADRVRIDDLLQRERSFSSHVSHQLRTPVAAMRVAIETELEAPRPDASTVLRESIEALDRLESTVGSLLAFARHDQRPPVECDLSMLVGERVEQWRPIAESAHRTLGFESRPIRAVVDTDAVGHILDVVLDNAIRHGRGSIMVTVTARASVALIDVSDSGSSARERDLFAVVRNDSSHGIGLRLARSLAESAGGELMLLDSPTTVFRLVLPIGDHTFT